MANGTGEILSVNSRHGFDNRRAAFFLREHLNQTTIAFALLLVVLFTAILRGCRPALVNALLAALNFNFFFLPPYNALPIHDPQNWVALAIFLITAFCADLLWRFSQTTMNDRIDPKTIRLVEELQSISAAHRIPKQGKSKNQAIVKRHDTTIQFEGNE